MNARAEGLGPRAGGGARTYLLVAGTLCVLLAVLGFTLVTSGEPAQGRWFSADPAQSTLHGALGIAAIAAGLLGSARQPAAAKALAIALLALAVLGMLTPRLFGYPERMGLSLRWEVGENVAHLILGGWGAYVATNAQDE